MRNLKSDVAFAIANETAAAIATARAFVRDAEIAATAKVRAAHFSNCRGCQAGLENFMIEYPDCSDAAVQSYLEDVVFLDCEPCTSDYNAHIEAQSQAHVDAEFGRLCIESDKDDKAIAEAMKCI